MCIWFNWCQISPSTTISLLEYHEACIFFRVSTSNDFRCMTFKALGSFNSSCRKRRRCLCGIDQDDRYSQKCNPHLSNRSCQHTTWWIIMFMTRYKQLFRNHQNLIFKTMEANTSHITSCVHVCLLWTHQMRWIFVDPMSWF